MSEERTLGTAERVWPRRGIARARLTSEPHLFGLVHPKTPRWHDACEHHRNGVCEEMTEDDFEIRNRPQSTQVDLLIDRDR